MDFLPLALHAVGPQSGHIVDLWRITLTVCMVVFAAVLVAFLWAIARAPRGSRETPPDMASQVRPEGRLQRNVAWATGVSAALLLVLLVASVGTDRALASLAMRDALHIEITGHQWWWSVRYEDGGPADNFQTANELHVPVGRPVILTLRADDVIHSWWVPQLGGKKDLIPGHETTYSFRADAPGTYRGQCAEFCGLQHTWMAMQVVAEPPARYQAWVERQKQSAVEPTSDVLLRGREVFLGGSCAMCHAITGTDASGRRAPDLTHIASRGWLASGALANTSENMARWIRDPQSVKPGTNMPPNALSDADLNVLVAYLGSLK